MGKALTEILPFGQRLVHQVEEIIVPSHQVGRTSGHGKIDVGLIIGIAWVGKDFRHRGERSCSIPKSCEEFFDPRVCKGRKTFPGLGTTEDIAHLGEDGFTHTEFDLALIDQDAALKQYAVSAGAAVFRTNCATCHGSGAAGVTGKGYPNLLDNDWLWGGSLAAIHTTVTHGIRNTTDPDARLSEMPRFGTDGLLTRGQIGQVVEFVLQIAGQDHDAALAVGGRQVFADNCAACHGDDGRGNRDLGAPNLADAIWLYGDDRATITTTVSQSRNGVMPAWGYAPQGAAPRLTEDQIRAVAVYVHALGGGE